MYVARTSQLDASGSFISERISNPHLSAHNTKQTSVVSVNSPWAPCEKEEANDAHKLIDRNARACASIAGSVARRSIDDAPQNPATPCVLRSTNSASDGSAIGPP